MAQIKASLEFDRDYKKLKKRATKSMEAQYLTELIENSKNKLKQNPEAGEKIPKKQWPKEYVKKYGINNLWKFNLDFYWRFTYTLIGTKVELFAIYLEFMDHKKYDRRFGYNS